MTNKYHAKKTIADGVTFASKREAKRYGELKLLLRAAEIAGLELQPRYDLIVNGIKVGRYTPDFTYREVKSGIRVVEESKGFRVRDYALRRNLFKALYPDLEHREV